ncbi:uncharacterized protein Dvir_GJ27012 [Drosophila virilis]|uniref:Pre-C2HC domain-containing protein n=1 Tax=Drosophila virilis TaxID=7244 RepID=A0A0Q9WWN1_DROVI|nr:uncharacterized protein Dvir_GJ27012 [Drosophila virilis]
MATNNRPQNSRETHSPIYRLPASSTTSPSNMTTNVDRLDGNSPPEDFTSITTQQPQQHDTASTTTATTTTATSSSSSGCRTSASLGTSRAALEPIGTRPKTTNPTLQSTPSGTQSSSLAAASCATKPPLPPNKNVGAMPAFYEPLVYWQRKRRGATLLVEAVKKGKPLKNRNTSRTGTKPVTPNTASTSSNRFALFEPQDDVSEIDEDDMDTADKPPPAPDQQQAAKKISKPGPISVPGVSEIVAVEQTIDQSVGPDSYEFKVSPSGYLRIYAKDADTHRAIVRKLTEKPAAFTSHGHTVTNLFDPGARQPTSEASADLTNDSPSRNFWFADLKQDVKNREALRLNRVDRQRVTIELPRTSNSIRQCYRCFEFDHTKNYCLKQSHWMNAEQCQAKTRNTNGCYHGGDSFELL